MKIHFWGVRGSIPTPGSPGFVTSRYGGNTTCISLEAPGIIVILDAGSGLRNLGVRLASRHPLKAVFLFSHLHWDHIQGFPFFAPAYKTGNEFELYGPGPASGGHSVLEQALRGQQGKLYFPVPLSDLSAALHFAALNDGQQVVIQGTRSRLIATAAAVHHPGGCLAYRLEEQTEHGRAAFVYATDTEHTQTPDPQLQQLAKGADALYYDAQYTEAEYNGVNGDSHKGWGHSTWRAGLREAQAAGVKRLLLGHHDPLHDDWAIAQMESEARVAGKKCGVRAEAAFEGQEIEI